jgi:hypothetical protein
MGLRADEISGFTNDTQLDPTFNLIYSASPNTTFHGGYARYMDTPGLQAINPGSQASFNGTTNQQVPGQVNPFASSDQIWDVGWSQLLNKHFAYTVDNFYELNKHYGDEGQFGVVPIFTNLSYDHGTTSGNEVGVKYVNGPTSGYFNVSYAHSIQFGADAGQFNFSAANLLAVDTVGLIIDHAPALSGSAGLTFKWKDYTINADYLYSSGLRGGSANQLPEPIVSQMNLAFRRSYNVPGLGEVQNRFVIENVFDTQNPIRPGGGIGVFQAAFGPRFSLFDALTIPLGRGAHRASSAPAPSVPVPSGHY